MPECVAQWVATHDYLACQEIQDDILVSYEDDFPKYRKRVDTTLLRHTLRSAAEQATRKFVYAQVGDYKTAEVKRALDLLILAGLLIPVTHTSANGLPLGSGADNSYMKIIPLDCALTLRLLNMTMPDSSSLTTHILTAPAADDILVSYEDDFPKYRKRVDTTLLRHTLRSAAEQATRKFVYAQVGDYKTAEVKRALDLLILAGLLIPVTHTSANGLPLGSGADNSYMKIIPLDCALTLRLLNMTMPDSSSLTTHILTAPAADLVNKGAMAELVAGLELLHYQSPHLRHEMFYWTRQTKNSLAEIDYLTVQDMHVLPIEVKAGTQGGMKSLWIFMREKQLTEAVRCSLENFGSLEYIDKEDNNAVRHVRICPLYAISSLL